MRIIILGCGYLGYNLYSLMKSEYETELWGIDSPYVPLLDRFTEVDAFNSVELGKHDLKDAIVIDAIGLVANNAMAENEEAALAVIKDKYTALVDSLKKGGIKRFVYFSSGGTIYGDSNRPISEKHAINPQTLYAKSKAVTEGVIRESGIDYLILRLSNPYGGYQLSGKRQGVIPILIRDVLLDQPFELWTDLNSIRDYFYITDLKEAIKGLIEYDINNETVNVGSGIGTSLKKVIETVEAVCGDKIDIHIQNSDVPVVEAIVLDISKLTALTGYQPTVDLLEGIRLEAERIKKELN